MSGRYSRRSIAAMSKQRSLGRIKLEVERQRWREDARAKHGDSASAMGADMEDAAIVQMQVEQSIREYEAGRKGTRGIGGSGPSRRVVYTPSKESSNG